MISALGSHAADVPMTTAEAPSASVPPAASWAPGFAPWPEDCDFMPPEYSAQGDKGLRRWIADKGAGKGRYAGRGTYKAPMFD